MKRGWSALPALAALLLGATLAAAETGTLWSVELESAPASVCLLANGSYLAVGYAGGASLYRLADEGVARWSWSSAGAQDAVLLRGDSSDVYFFGLVIGADSALVQRWSTAHSDPLWSVELPDDLVPIGAAGFDVDRRGEFAAVLAADGDDNAVLLLIDQDGALQRFEPPG